jgi:hypothetical protein
MLSRGVSAAWVAVLATAPCVLPATALASDGPEAERVVGLVHELFPEVESELTLPGGPGEALARLRIGLGQEEACARARSAYDAFRRFSGGILLGGYADRTRTADCRVTVVANGGGSIGAFVLARAGRATVADVFGSLGQVTDVPLPPRRALPEPALWLCPLAGGGAP